MPDITYFINSLSFYVKKHTKMKDITDVKHEK